MAYSAGTTGSLQSELIDLSGVSLDELREVSGLPRALAALREQLAAASAPLCDGNMAALCGGGPRVLTGVNRDS
jgi:hypothetical protein